MYKSGINLILLHLSYDLTKKIMKFKTLVFQCFTLRRHFFSALRQLKKQQGYQPFHKGAKNLLGHRY